MKVTVRVASFVVEPSLTALLLPLTAVMAIVGLRSFRVTVLLLCEVEAAFPTKSYIEVLVGRMVRVSVPSGVPDREISNTYPESELV